jgi:short-subunit dehydrogenase
LLLQMGSIAGRLALPFLGLYAATKFALEGLTESYRDELAPFGVDAAIIEPGTYPTSIKEKGLSGADIGRAALYQNAVDAFTTPFFGACQKFCVTVLYGLLTVLYGLTMKAVPGYGFGHD